MQFHSVGEKGVARRCRSEGLHVLEKLKRCITKEQNNIVISSTHATRLGCRRLFMIANKTRKVLHGIAMGIGKIAKKGREQEGEER